MSNTTEIINDIVPPSRITRLAAEFETSSKRYPNGRITRKRHRASPVIRLEVEWDGITLAQFELLRAFFYARAGGFGSFRVRDTHTETLHTVVFSDDALSRENVKPNVRGLYKIKLKMETA